ncbi:Equilibrative nucleoside transporter [Trinorchestia longiramus]|nr:Equilibrative nucleoside transporter [Trinorchestia longiramus]
MGENHILSAPLASVEDLSRVNTPGGSPSPRQKLRHPALSDPNWEPPEDPSFDANSSSKGLELTPLHPKTEDEAEEKAKYDGPPDRLALVFLTLTLHGVGTLMPWNMFITAYSYFIDYKLVDDEGAKTEYAKNFLSYVGYASQVPNVIFNWINIFVQLGGDITTRVVGSILVEVALFILTVVLAMVDSSDWQAAFFWTTMVTIVIINIANGIYQNTVYGMAARLPFKYTGAVVLGSNISGTFTAVINIIALLLAPNLRTSAIYYFITALFILLACFDTYFALPLNRFFRYHEVQYEKAQKSKRVPGVGKARVPYWYIFKRAFPQLLNVFMVFFVTLAVFPAVLADTCRSDENFFIPNKLFQAITCYLTFNLLAMIGNMLPGLFMWPGPRFLWIPVFLRLLLIPAFLLCHYYPVGSIRVMPVLIDSDWGYWALGIVLGLTSGYYSSLAMMYCPQTVEPEHAQVAGMMAAASLVTGIFAGINFQMVCAWLVTNVAFDGPGLEYARNCTD